MTFLTNVSSISIIGTATKGFLLPLVDPSFLEDITKPHCLKLVKISLATKHFQQVMLEMSRMASDKKVSSPASSKFGIC
jgi:hypothetical protein